MCLLIGGSWGHQITIGKIEGGANFTWASPDYFETMGIPLLSGHGFTDGDTAASQRVAVVNQTFVRRFLNGADPIGRDPAHASRARLSFHRLPDCRRDGGFQI